MTISWSLGKQPHQPTGQPEPQVSEVASAWIGQRRYLANLPYALPKDAPEAHRLDFQHFYLRAALQGLYRVPLETHRLEFVLDVGCGTGRWAHEMALAYPQAQVFGLDIDTPPPAALPVPPNFTFVQGNVLQPLPFPDGSFDFVHQRLLAAAIPTQNWPLVIAEFARVARPGGWIELVEASDAYLNAGPELQRFLSWGRAVSAARGVDVGRVAHLDELLHGASLAGVEQQVMHLPVGNWGGRLGHSLAQNVYAAFAGLRGVFCQALMLPPDQFDATLAALSDEWNTYHTKCSLYIFQACKR